MMLRTARLLRRHGHDVSLMGMGPEAEAVEDFPTYTVSSLDYHQLQSWCEQATAAARMLYSLEAKRCMRRLISRERPDVVHFHNIYHQLSPSIIDAAAEAGVPCVMTLHDYKLTCAIYCHNRRGTVCEDCRYGRYWNVARHRCTDNFLPRSLLNALEMYLHHRVLRIYRQLDAFIAPSRFLRDKTEELGSEGKLVHLPYFLNPADFEPTYAPDTGRIIYFGRLAPEKGLLTLLDAMKDTDLELLLVGRGPMETRLRRKTHRLRLKNVRFVGFQPQSELKRIVARCSFAVIPSIWYENYPVSVMESFAQGKPVVGADIGGIPELVGRNRGLLFEPGNPADLRKKLQELASSPEKTERMGRRAREFVEEELNPEKHHNTLLRIYHSCIRASSG